MESGYRPLLVKATGTGKTVVFSHIAKEYLPYGRVVVLAHRTELIKQAKKTLESITRVDAGIEMANQHADDARIVVGSVATMCKPRRLRRFDPEEVSLVIIDEAHHAPANSYRKILKHLLSGQARLCGVTATPDRGDGVALGTIFDTVSFRYDIQTAIRDGYLCPIRQTTIKNVKLDLSGVRTRAGDFATDDLDRIMRAEGPVQGVASACLDEAGDRQTMIFCSSVDHADLLRDILNRHKPGSAAFICGKTPREEREVLLEMYAAGEIQYMCNVGVFTEGYDCPRIEVVVIARPTQSRSLYCLDSQTEILGDNGWFGICDDTPIAAAAFSHDGGVEMQPIVSSIVRPLYDGEKMFGIENPHTSIRVTDKHNMVCRKRFGRRRDRTSWEFVKAEVAAEIPDLFEIPVAGSEASHGVDLPDAEIRFIGLVMTDGNINPCNNAITLYQSERYGYCIEYIESVIKECGFKFGHSVDSSPTNFGPRNYVLHRWTISKGKPRGRDSHLKGWAGLSDYMSKDFEGWMNDLTRRQLLILIEAMNIGDGCKSPNIPHERRTMSIATWRHSVADGIQALCVRRNIRCNIGVAGTDGDGYMLHINPEKQSWTVPTNKTDGRPLFQEVSSMPGELIWCIEVPSGMIITRRKGKVAVLGNCQMVGRGTRLNEGKPFLEVFDFAANAGKHTLMNPVNMLGGDPPSDAVRERAKEEFGEEKVDIMDLEEWMQAEEEKMHKREALEAAKANEAWMTARATYEKLEVCPFTATGLKIPEVPDLKSSNKITAKQEKAIVRMGGKGLPVDHMTTKEAQSLIFQLKRRHEEGKASVKQCGILAEYGYDGSRMTRQEASFKIGRIAASGWQRPEEDRAVPRVDKAVEHGLFV